MRTLTIAAAILFMGTSCYAQVVQQPVFRNFSYSGSAWVPDSGTASLGGNVSSRSSSISRGGIGPYAQRSSGSGLGGRSLSASVTIIDLNALDEALLNTPISPAKPAPADAPNGGPAAQAPQAKALMSLAGVGTKILNTTGTNDLPTGIRASDPNAYNRALKGHAIVPRRAAVDSLRESDIRYYLSEGMKAEKAGRIVSARVYFKMAMEAMTPEMLERYERVVAQRKQAEEDRKARNRPDSIKF